MKNQITPREYELLSAYLDNQLGGKERARLESQLLNDQGLRKELQEIEKTRSLLHSLPRLRAPHNYFINPEVVTKQAGVHQRLRLAPAYGIVSAIATILLVLVVFGDRLLTSTSPVAFAPAPVASMESLAEQQEAQRSVASPSSPTEAASVVMMGAPVIASPETSTAVAKVGEAEIATPTTIYLNAYPPTSTPEVLMSIMNDQTVTATISCEEYDASGAYPTLPYLNNCPTPSGSGSGILQSIPPTSTLTSSSTPLPTATITPTPDDTPSPTPTPTPSATPAPTETPPGIENAAPGSQNEAPLPAAPSDQMVGAGTPTPKSSESAETAGTTPNFDFMQYLVLAIEISLAAIAICAGIIAIVLRIRAGL
jgi:hypothetical protein